ISFIGFSFGICISGDGAFPVDTGSCGQTSGNPISRVVSEFKCFRIAGISLSDGRKAQTRFSMARRGVDGHFTGGCQQNVNSGSLSVSMGCVGLVAGLLAPKVHPVCSVNPPSTLRPAASL